jgi:hypothetical protein
VSSNPAPILLDEETHTPLIFDDPSGIISVLYLLYSDTGRLTEGIDQFRSLARIYGKNYWVDDIHFDLGKFYLAAKQKSLALDEYQILKAAGSAWAEILFREIYK